MASDDVSRREAERLRGMDAPARVARTFEVLAETGALWVWGDEDEILFTEDARRTTLLPIWPYGPSTWKSRTGLLIGTSGRRGLTSILRRGRSGCRARGDARRTERPAGRRRLRGGDRAGRPRPHQQPRGRGRQGSAAARCRRPRHGGATRQPPQADHASLQRLGCLEAADLGPVRGSHTAKAARPRSTPTKPPSSLTGRGGWRRSA